jgi:hypothetical protein
MKTRDELGKQFEQNGSPEIEMPPFLNRESAKTTDLLLPAGDSSRDGD